MTAQPAAQIVSIIGSALIALCAQFPIAGRASLGVLSSRNGTMTVPITYIIPSTSFLLLDQKKRCQQQEAISKFNAVVLIA